MNQRHCAEVAALVSAYSRHVVERGERLPGAAIDKYVDCSQERFRCWQAAIRGFRRQHFEGSPVARCQMWYELEPILEQIFVTEMLTRVWGAVLVATDQQMETQDYEPAARQVLIQHLEIRKQALQLLVSDTTIMLDHLTRIDRLRQRVERWTDLLLGHLIESHLVEDFAIDPVRCMEFSPQRLLQTFERPAEQTWALLLSGLRMAFPGKTVSHCDYDRMQHEIISSILACFPPETVLVDGPFVSILEQRVFLQTKLAGARRVPLMPGPLRVTAVVPSATWSPSIDFSKLRHPRRPPPSNGL